MRLLNLDTLATVFVGRLDPSSDLRSFRFTFANAGHPPPLIVQPSGTVDVLDNDPVDPLLGVGQQPRSEREISLSAGTTLVLYTDGLVERRDQSVDVGIERLRHALADLATAPPERLCEAVLERLLPARVEDDVALLVIRPRPPVSVGAPARSPDTAVASS
jgi:serine phosphatase RsbU (regulator of sigma subunit)